MNKTWRERTFSAGNIARMAVLAAIASILFVIEIPIVAFYKLDLSNLPVLLGAFSMGVVPGLIILLLKSASCRYRLHRVCQSRLRYIHRRRKW